MKLFGEAKKAIRVLKKNSRLSQMSKRELAHILLWRREFTERKPHCVLNKKATIFFIEGACDRFLLSDFPVLAQNRFTWMESRWESSLS